MRGCQWTPDICIRSKKKIRDGNLSHPRQTNVWEHRVQNNTVSSVALNRLNGKWQIDGDCFAQSVQYFQTGLWLIDKWLHRGKYYTRARSPETIVCACVLHPKRALKWRRTRDSLLSKPFLLVFSFSNCPHSPNKPNRRSTGGRKRMLPVKPHHPHAHSFVPLHSFVGTYSSCATVHTKR